MQSHVAYLPLTHDLIDSFTVTIVSKFVIKSSTEILAHGLMVGWLRFNGAFNANSVISRP